MEYIISEGINQLKSPAIDEASRYGRGEHELLGHKFSIKRGKGKYDFSNVTIWNSIQNDLKKIEELSKTAYKQQQPIILQETGEYIEPCDFKGGGESIFVTISK